MTTLSTVKTELEKSNIPTTGMYDFTPQSTFDLIIEILHFGEDALKNSSLGNGIKRLL